MIGEYYCNSNSRQTTPQQTADHFTYLHRALVLQTHTKYSIHSLVDFLVILSQIPRAQHGYFTNIEINKVVVIGNKEIQNTYATVD